MEPGFAIRSDEEWERIFNKKKYSVLPIGDGENPKVRNSAKKWAQDGTRTRTRTHVGMSERPDPIHQDWEGTSHQAQSLARHDRPLYTSEYDSEYDEESSEYDIEYTTEGPHSDQGNCDNEDDLDRAFQVEERKRRNRWIKRKLHKSN
jgi:hypothetical protein